MWTKEDAARAKAKQREAQRHACPRCGATAYKSALCQRCATAINNKQRAEAAPSRNGWYPDGWRDDNADEWRWASQARS